MPSIFSNCPGLIITCRDLFGTLPNTYDDLSCENSERKEWKPLTILVKHCILDVWQGSEYVSDINLKLGVSEDGTPPPE